MLRLRRWNFSWHELSIGVMQARCLGIVAILAATGCTSAGPAPTIDAEADRAVAAPTHPRIPEMPVADPFTPETPVPSPGAPVCKAFLKLVWVCRAPPGRGSELARRAVSSAARKAERLDQDPRTRQDARDLCQDAADKAIRRMRSVGCSPG